MTTSADACWHCGEPVPANVVIQASVGGIQRAMCCHGCRAAAQWIEQIGLADYYRLRTQAAQKPVEGDADRRAWQRPEIARHVVRDLGGSRRETMLLVEGLRCSACVWLIERALSGLPGVTSVQVNAVAQRARVSWNDDAIRLHQILDQLARAGYRALPLDKQALDDVRRRESRDALKRLLVAAFGSMQAMMFAAVLYLGTDTSAPTYELFRWLGFIVATPVVFYSARPFFAGARRSLAARQLGMDIPVAAAIAIIYAASLIEALSGGVHVYFDSVAMFVFFLLGGRYIEMRARHRAGDLTDALARLTPPFAERRTTSGTIERVGVHELQVGDCVRIGEGGIVPADGTMLAQTCRVDEALLSGESTPVSRRHGDMLIAGSVLIDGPVDIRVARVGAQTTLAGIASLVERAQTQRPQLARTGERAARLLIGRVLVMTLATASAWALFDPSRAFSAALAVLVVSCPCAFALAVPAAITRTLAVMARRGVLVVKPDAVQALAEATHVVFDKTGTLTTPQLALGDIETFGIPRGEALRLAAALARESHHPAARAIALACMDERIEAASGVASQTGFGIRGTVAGRELRLGRADFALAGRALPAGEDDRIVLAGVEGPIATFRLEEQLRPGARTLVDALKAQGLHVSIASGDALLRVAAIAAQLGITDFRARQLPADKLAWLAQLRAAGARVAAVGDGVNDAPVLAGADVAIAVSGAAELAQASSDIVINSVRLDALASARHLARQTLAVIQQNQRGSMFYNLTAIPLAALGFVPPWLAALGMSLSSLCVVLNALRIGRSRRSVSAPQAAAAPAVLARRAGAA